jgi:hypothetical protein
MEERFLAFLKDLEEIEKKHGVTLWSGDGGALCLESESGVVVEPEDVWRWERQQNEDK